MLSSKDILSTALPRDGHFVYYIQNIGDGKNSSYIGSTRSVWHRWRGHLHPLRNNNHSNPKLQNAWNKYGEDSFVWKSLGDFCNDWDMLLAEQETLDFFRLHVPVYNIVMCVIPGLVTGHKLSQEHKDAIASDYPQLRNFITGEIIPPGRNIKTLCERHRFNYGRMLEMLRGESSNHHGWQLDGSPNPEAAPNVKEYPALINMYTGQTVEPGINISDLARQLDVDSKGLTNMLAGKAKHAYGWYIKSNKKPHKRGTKPYPALIHKVTGRIIPGGHNRLRVAKELGFPLTSLYKVFNGQLSHCRGWRVKSEA